MLFQLVKISFKFIFSVFYFQPILRLGLFSFLFNKLQQRLAPKTLANTRSLALVSHHAETLGLKTVTRAWGSPNSANFISKSFPLHYRLSRIIYTMFFARSRSVLNVLATSVMLKFFFRNNNLFLLTCNTVQEQYSPGNLRP